MDEQYIKDGFVKAYIVQIDNVDEPCDFLIKLENGNLLEPLNLSAGFKQNNISVWLKYNMQRRQSRCSNTQPVEIIDIKK